MEACIASARLGRSECARLFAPAILVRPSDLGLMRKSELVEFHEREAARYRRLVANVTTPSLKTRFAEQAEQHEVSPNR